MNNLEYKGYLGSIDYDKESKMLVGKVLGMTSDCILYEGNNVEELENDFQNAINSYIESCHEMGIKPRKSYNGNLNIRIPADIHSQIIVYAHKYGTTLNSIVKNALKKQLEHEYA